MIKHAIKGGFTNLIRSFWISATAITVLTVSLCTVALVASLSTVVGFALRRLDNFIDINAYYASTVDVSTRDKSIEEIKQISEVKEVRFISKEEAESTLKSKGLGKSIDTLKKNNTTTILLDSIQIRPKSAENYIKIVDILNSDKYKSIWDKNQVESKVDAINNLQRIYRWSNYGFIILVIFFGLVSILVMINILRITIYHRKNEIEIMRLVGATNGYIRGPFVFEGALYNIIASLIVAIIFIPGIALLIPWIESYLKITTSSYTQALLFQLYLSIFGTIIIGTVVGVITAYFATKRYLKL
jgi:cell division transport system permease protein